MDRSGSPVAPLPSTFRLLFPGGNGCRGRPSFVQETRREIHRSDRRRLCPLDSTVDGFHDSFGFGTAGRDLVARDRFQAVASLQGQRIAFLGPPADSGWGDRVLGLRRSWPLRSWNLVLAGAVKLALRGERPGLSTGSNDYGLQASLQRRLGRQGIYLSATLVHTDGKVFGVPVGSRTVPTQASLGLRSRRGNLVYGFAPTENLVNFQNTPDVGLSLTLGWIASGRTPPGSR